MIVNFQIFKPSGKWYTEDTMELHAEYFYEMIDEVNSMISSNNIPGIGSGAKQVWHMLVTPKDGVPHLFVNAGRYTITKDF